VAGDRTHIGTYVGVSPSPASNENNLKNSAKEILRNFLFLKVIHSFACKLLYLIAICEIIILVRSNKYFGRFIAN
jgi:hypothetical protein